MSTRPLALALATVLLTVIGVAFALGGALLLVLATGRIPLLDSMTAAGPVLLVGIGAIVAAWFAWLAAGSLWRGRARGWVASLIIAVVSVGGALTVAGNAGPQALVVVGVAVTVVAFVALVVPSTRAAVGVR